MIDQAQSIPSALDLFIQDKNNVSNVTNIYIYIYIVCVCAHDVFVMDINPSDPPNTNHVSYAQLIPLEKNISKALGLINILRFLEPMFKKIKES